MFHFATQLAGHVCFEMQFRDAVYSQPGGELTPQKIAGMRQRFENGFGIRIFRDADPHHGMPLVGRDLHFGHDRGAYARIRHFVSDHLGQFLADSFGDALSAMIHWYSGSRRQAAGGLDCLRHYCIQLDFEAGKMRFMDSARLNVEKLGRAFPITIAGGRPYICHPSLAGGTSTNSLADTNTDDGKDKGRELPVGRDLPVTYSLIDTGFDADGRVNKGAIKGHDSGRVRLPECVWDGQTYTNLVVGVGEQANLLGLRFLARHLVTLDFPRQTMYLKQTSAGPLAGERQKRQSNEQGGADGRQPSH